MLKCLLGIGIFLASTVSHAETIELSSSQKIFPIHVVSGTVETVRNGGFFKTMRFVVDAAFYFPCALPNDPTELAWRFVTRDTEKRDIYEIVQLRQSIDASCLPVREPIIVKLQSEEMTFNRLLAPSAIVVNTVEIPVNF